MIESEETFKLFRDSCDLITESINELIFITNQRNEIEYSNKFPVIKSLGYKNDELIGNSWLNYVCPEDLETTINLLEKILLLFQKSQSLLPLGAFFKLILVQNKVFFQKF